MFIERLWRNSILVEPSLELSVVHADPTDNRVLEAAVEGQADYIVTGDGDLLELGAFEGTRIVTPRDFVAILAREAGQ
jgi:predicted nucleic acid-binding protein